MTISSDSVSGLPENLNGVLGLGDAEVFVVDMPLAKGAEANLRQKFSISGQRAALAGLPALLSNGTMHLGNLDAGEIHITGVRRVWTHRFWTEMQLHVQMPPKKPGDAPIDAAFAGIMVAHKFYPGVSALIVVDHDKIALTKIYRFHGCYRETLPGRGKGWRLECPRGGFKPGESPEAGALREAGEEAGVTVRAASDEDPGTEVISLGAIEPDSGILMSSVALFAIRGVDIDSAKVHLDVTEAPTETVLVSVDDALRMIQRGEISCGITIASITQALVRGIIRAKSLA